MQHDAAGERDEKDQRLAHFVQDGTIVLPTGDSLASLWDSDTWRFAFLALFYHGDCVPYLDRAKVWST